MTPNKSYQVTALLLFLLPLFSIGWKLSNGYLTTEKLIPATAYKVQLNFSIDSFSVDEDLFVKSFLPENNQHQKISQRSATTGQLGFSTSQIEGTGKKGEWRGKAKGRQELGYSFRYEGKAMRFQMDNHLLLQADVPASVAPYLKPEEHIQSDNIFIKTFADNLGANKNDVKSVVEAMYKFVRLMPSEKTSELTDALTAYMKHRASCNGKSRLLTALCRAVDIPARVVGGVILENAEKRTSHLWTEIWMGDQWVPFDALNGHFAYLPANYMQLYIGDYFLIAHTPDVQFDYSFSILKEKYFAPQKAGFFTLWNLLTQNSIPIDLLKVILLLPLCAFIVGVFKNVIGLKTIGVFLPAIIAVSLQSVGPGFGLLAFAIVIAIVSLLHFPLEKWGILYTPKLIIMLTGVVICLLVITKFGVASGNQTMSGMIFFPIIILTIAAEKFAKTIVEEGFADAMKLQAQTLLLTFICYLVFAPDFLVGYFLTFPETYAWIIGLLLLLGRWIGLRMTEYIRFKALVTS